MFSEISQDQTDLPLSDLNIDGLVFTSFIGFSILFILGCAIYLCSILKEKGPSYRIKYYIAKTRIQHFQEKLKKKFVYENLQKASVSAVDVGLIPSDYEYECENPCKKTFEHCDGVHFFGIDSKQNLIDVCLNKIQDNVASVWIYLKLANGEEYKLPYTKDTRKPYIDNEYLFYSSGLQIKCLSPLRKWRISFNGLLQKLVLQDQGKEKRLHHVKFSFVWLSMSVVQELNFNFSSKDLAHAFSEASCGINFGNLSKFWELQNRYEQWGQLMGTMSINGESEQDLYLWSARTRILDNPLWNEDFSYAKFYMYFEDGFPLKVENLSVSNFISNFTNGYTIDGLGALKYISDCYYNTQHLIKNSTDPKVEFSFKINGETNRISIQYDINAVQFYTGPELQMSLIMKPFKVIKNNIDHGFGILHLGFRCEQESILNIQCPPLLLKDAGYSSNEKSVLMLNDELCKSSQIAGGKGCSLALLTELSERLQDIFTVPKGFVITTAAFENHIKKNKTLNLAIQRLNNIACQIVEGDLKQECSRCIEDFSSVWLSDELRSEIQDALLKLFPSLDTLRFSVRSSACGEDSDDMSAAGQMLTVLGISGINNIFDAVIKCWSSKFSFEAVQYARQNGQPLNSSMAVVIQEMVPSETSGVMFTVDPVTGNPLHIYITANYGLGETVVSSLAEPDTIILEKRMDNSVFIVQKSIGAKMIQVHMNVSGGVEQKKLTSALNMSCLSDEWAEKIGRVGLLVENCFCGPRDIEWAVQGDKLYLLQARPITTLHTETEFEFIHDQDTPTRSHHEYWTRANTGEVFLGASSPLGISLVVGAMDIFSHQKHVLREKQVSAYCPYILHSLPVTHKQVTLSVIDTLFRSNEKEISVIQRAFEVGIFGRIITTAEMHKAGIKKHGLAPKRRKWWMFAFLFMLSFKIPKDVKMLALQSKKYKLPLETYINATTTFEGILKQMNFFSMVSAAHGMATFLSSIYNVIVLSILARGKIEWDLELYSDFATLLSSCSGVESADVPGSLQELSKTIAEHMGDAFAKLSTSDAYTVLKNDKGIVGEQFEEFLKKHGHRCVKEFDLYSVSWRMNPEILIPIFQNLIKSAHIPNSNLKEEVPIDAAVSKIKTPLSKTSKIILKTVLPWSRSAVGQREKTKSLLIKVVDWLRQSCHVLGKMMVQEGLLPDSELIFFLTLEEIKDILDFRKNGLVQKAIRRRRLHPKLDALLFPEIIEGIPKPVSKQDDSGSDYSSSFTLKGTPVSQGKVKAKAKVILTLEDASTIQKGDVLITHATDTGWSPYFPLLSGVVTVLGGLISHGAVVAREYGLPCIVGVENATTAFKTGDVVLLDGAKGTITKVIDKETEK